LNALGLLQRGAARAVGSARVAGVELEPRQQQLAHGGFARRRPLREKL
jgi:hypothetical protein